MRLTHSWTVGLCAVGLYFGSLAGCSDEGHDTVPLGSSGRGGSSGTQDGGAGQAGTSGTGGVGTGGSSTVDASDSASMDVTAESGSDTATDHNSDSDSDSEAIKTCQTTFRFQPGGTVSSVVVAGEWHNFDLATATPLVGPDNTGTYTGTVNLSPGLYAYKFVVNGTDWRLDPNQPRRKYFGIDPDKVENSAIKVAACHIPSLSVQSSKVERQSAGQGKYDAQLVFHDGVEGSGADSAAVTATLAQDGSQATLQAPQVTVSASGDVALHLEGLADGKYRVLVQTASKNGKRSEPLRLVFWVEPEVFSWRDAVVYMAVTDRYRDGDPSNNTPATAEADPRGDFHGGDLQGLRESIAEGKLDQLGVRAIWLTPFQTNPTGAFLADDNIHKVTGYHGYWPIRARQVEPRIGGADGLRELVQEAHRHGIRVLQDFVVNHVHEQHEYVSQHPDWFRTGCVCGSECDWTTHALDCMFAKYLPDINHTVPEANAQFVADAVWWLDEFDLDGLRVDAVKHVEEVATRNLAAEVRELFEGAGTRYFLMGETAMGWGDCPCDQTCNDENYGTISKYIGPFGLDGQFDFVLYHGVSKSTFAYGDRGMIHADYWVQCNQKRFPAGAIMTPYIGSHDTERFSSLADYRGQDAEHDRGFPGRKWDSPLTAPSDDEPYQRTRISMAWLLGLPGAPLLYYGDEYGQWGGADPNNRVMWRNDASLNVQEAETLALVRKVGTARAKIAALRRGTYVPLLLASGSPAVTEDIMVTGRKGTGGQSAVVGLSRMTTPQWVEVEVADSLDLPAGTTLHDHLGGPDVVVTGHGRANVAIPAKGAVILAP